ncbi:family 43 glycosylhydrolase [Kribbella qitaiheensis]|uniref:Family 43 glycosylhydrolase n=1 Tax=Kribbella qitaiheensis TaxID=1544730 RepID=A0A7G6X535_9ACTN|nr:family 43 glycosylhydrolase [Kribbella qitaiheensis]QNE21350.1 family 43 glycosylhydrolase [Kribbella qitaiheensis]
MSALLRLLVVPVLLAGVALSAVGPAEARPDRGQPGAESSVTLVNKDAQGNAAIRFDVHGEAIDAHDGQIQRFGNTYYLYGTAYGCGYEWNTPGAPFCGFVSYSSPDLVNWTPRGFLFDASTSTWQSRCDGTTYGCYRPHVVFNKQTGRYVLWINTYDNGVGYRVFTSKSPAAGFVEVAEPDLAAPEGPPRAVNYGDHQIFVDDDGQAYLAFTDWRRDGDLVVERLDKTYTTGSGAWSRVGIRRTEAPTIFKRAGTYYLTYSDPNRGYATTGTGFVTATSPLGPWTGTGMTPDAWSVVDGALHIDGGGIGLSRTGEDWSDYTFRATVTPERAAASDYGQVGLVVRASNAGSYQWLIGNYPHAGASGGNLT